MWILACDLTPAAADDAEAPKPRSAAPAKVRAEGKSGAPDGSRVPENPFPNRVKAPELEGGTEWLNVSGPITLRDLRGKVVILDFWTYCCINCMHVLPDLKYLERKYPRELVVIGVHSAKFDNEKESGSIRQAIMRYEIEHPVINDSEMAIWRKYGISSWPSFMFIDPEGYIFAAPRGEIGDSRPAVEAALDKVIAYHRAKGTLDETPVRFDLERRRVPATPLRYPGKVLADELGDRLFVSDSNHNRIVVAALDGKLREVIGTGEIGTADGAFDQATFHHPQGMALVGETLYVADTENHLLREIDLRHKTVKTLAGTGEQGADRRLGGDALKTAINSPWDLVHLGGRLFVCMAGPHQLWVLNLRDSTIAPFAGDGREDILNGPLSEAALAQPSGIATDGHVLYVVDSEGSALRRVTLGPQGDVSTIVGPSDLARGRSLFEFGDKDGVGPAVRLQHPLGVAFHDGTIYVADSYNHKIKRVNPQKRDSHTYLGDGHPGDRDRPAQFFEPAGLSVARRTLYVADTNNHRIRTVDLRSSSVGTLEIAGLEPPHPAPSTPAEVVNQSVTAVPPQRIASGANVTFEMTLVLPEGYKLNREFPLSYRLSAASRQTLIAEDKLGGPFEIAVPEEGKPVQFSVPLAARSGKADLRITLQYGYCRDGKGGLCKMGTSSWAIPVEAAGDGSTAPIKLAGDPAHDR